MRALSLLLLLSASLAHVSLVAQEQEATQTPKKGPERVSTEEGGVSEVLQSIVVPPKAGTPFTLTLETEWVKTLYDGGTVTLSTNGGLPVTRRDESIKNGGRWCRRTPTM
jgi:hypothetical protein